MRQLILVILVLIIWTKNYAQVGEGSTPSFNKYLKIRLLNIDSNKLYKQENIPVDFYIENTTQDSIYISNPYYWVNLDLVLYQDGQLVRQTLRARPIRGMRDAKILLKPREEHLFTFSIFLNKVYSEMYKQNGNYQLYIINTGNIWDKLQKQIWKEYKLASNTISFTI